MSARVRPPRVLRERLYLRSGGICERCGLPIDLATFHVAHLRSHVNGGALVEENLGAWCPRCNLSWGPADMEDTRVQPRPWQWKALVKVVEQIMGTRVATVAAAAGAGKTILTALVFEALYEADLIDRLVVVVPRRTLVRQWRDSLLRARHIELRPGAEVERRGQLGTIVTYQSLSAETVGVHRHQADLRSWHKVGPNDYPKGS